MIKTKSPKKPKMIKKNQMSCFHFYIEDKQVKWTNKTKTDLLFWQYIGGCQKGKWSGLEERE